MAIYRPSYTDPKTGEKKQAKVWWYNFSFAGQRIQESSKSTRKSVAKEAEKQKRLELERALAGIPSEKPETRIRTIAAALNEYESGYCVNHRQKSVLVVQNRSAHLERLLGSVLLHDISEKELLDYMSKRLEEGASNRTINIELSVLSRAIGRTWTALWPKLKKLSENHDVGRALEAEEEKRLLEAAARSTSPLIYPYLMTLAWTGLRADEARLLTWGQIDFEAGHVTVGKAKTDRGTGRMIPMSGALRAALEHHASWCASKLGPLRPDWHVFPFCHTKRPVDPSRPVTALKRAWESVREKSGVACRLHDLRHSFCTKLGEAGTPESTMLDMMGHVSAAMLRRYSHIRAQARRDAIAAMEARALSVGPTKVSTKVERSTENAKPVTH